MSAHDELTRTIIVALTLAACDGAGAMGSDAGADGWPNVAPPAPPVLTPCPDGWRAVTSDTGVTTCDPWPADGYHGASCAFDEAHFAGTPGCARVGTACAADGWPSDLPTDRPIVYVNDDATLGGDGSSRDRAYRTISDAILAAPSGAVIAVATGHYDERVNVIDHMTLWGACTLSTRITSSPVSEPDYVVQLGGDGAGVRNVAIDAPGCRGLHAVGVHDVTIEDVVVVSARGFGMFTRNASLTATNLVVRGTRDTTSLPGQGIDLDSATTATLSRVLLDDNRDTGLFVAGPSTSLDATDVVVRSTRPAPTHPTYGVGINVQSATTATLARVVVEDDRAVGIGIADIGTQITATDVVVRGTREATDGSDGYGLAVEAGATVSLARAWIDDNRGAGLLVTNHGSGGSASDLVITSTREQAGDGRYGYGAQIGTGAAFMLTRVVIDDHRTTGLSVLNAGSPVVASDLVVRRIAPSASDHQGIGVFVGLDSELQLARANIESTQVVGLGAVGGRVTASDVTIRDIAAGTDRGTPGTSLGGFGISANGSTVSVERFETQGATLCGVVLGGGDLTHVVSVDLHAGAIRSSSVGACVQIDGYDLDRLHHDVLITDVSVPLQATTYPLPMGMPSL